MKKNYSLDEIAEAVGVGRPTLIYHRDRWQHMTKPQQVGMRFFYSENDLKRIRNYFISRKPYERSRGI